MVKKKTAKKGNPLTKLLILIGVLILSYFGIIQLDGVDSFFGDAQDKTTQGTTSQSGDNPGIIENGPATFTDKELTDSTDGWIEYGDLDSLGRATTAEALIKQDMIGTGSSASQNIRPPGFISGLDPDNHSRGHLIGKQMGGSGEVMENLVTLYQNPVNTPYMTKYENMVRKAADEGQTIRYRVIPIYDGDIGMPIAVQMEGKSLNSTDIDFNITIENKK